MVCWNGRLSLAKKSLAHLFCRARVVYLDHLRRQIDADALVKVLTESLALRIVRASVLDPHGLLTGKDSCQVQREKTYSGHHAGPARIV